jgi:hypothetical protein
VRYCPVLQRLKLERKRVFLKSLLVGNRTLGSVPGLCGDS